MSTKNVRNHVGLPMDVGDVDIKSLNLLVPLELTVRKCLSVTEARVVSENVSLCPPYIVSQFL